MNRFVALALVATIGAACTVSHLAPAPDASPPAVATGRLVALATNPADTVAGEYGRFGVPASIAGRTLLLLADHGSNVSTLTDSAIDRSGLPHWYAGAARADTVIARDGRAPVLDSTAEMSTTRGDTTFEYWGVRDPTPVDSLHIGTSRQDTVLLPLELPATALAPFDGLLGRDVLSQFDLLFDLRAGTLQLFERSRGVANGRPPQWLPHGLTHDDCVAAHLLSHQLDTAGMDASDKAELSHNPGKRIWDQEELELPVVVNGRPIDALFDSGAAAATMNWPEARALGITRTSVNVAPYTEGSARLFTMNARATPRSSDSTFSVTGLELQIGNVRLPRDTLLISDPYFADIAKADSQPVLHVGLRHFRGRALFISYSTGFVCVSRQ